MTPFTISSDTVQRSDGMTGLIVQKGAGDADYDIILLNCSTDKQQKHKLHSLSQIALYQFEDNEIEVNQIKGCCTISGTGFDYQVTEALLLLQDNNNHISLYAHPTVAVKKYLDQAYRYCTRWIRLDI